MSAWAQNNQATNVSQAIENYEWLNAKMDTIKSKQDSLYEKWEKRIEQMKINQQEREKAKKPE